jgi:16S rRNA (guanine966-N2)-methyltransferase
VTRIVGGDLGGRVLLVPPGRGTRPTSERAREGLFNTLAGLVDLRGAAFLDLYAGSGAVGLEAASRGADRVLLVEADQRAAGTVKRNAAGLTAAAARVVVAPAERVVATPPSDGPYDVVFADPPYRETDERIDQLLAALSENGWLAAEAVLVVERDRRSREPAWPPGVRTLKSRDYGEATLWYGRRS